MVRELLKEKLLSLPEAGRHSATEALLDVSQSNKGIKLYHRYTITDLDNVLAAISYCKLYLTETRYGRKILPTGTSTLIIFAQQSLNKYNE